MGKLFILTGKMASGKDTLMTQILADCPHIKRMVSYTTRPQRKGEIDGYTYRFVTEDFFKQKDSEGKVIEVRIDETEDHRWLYGTFDERDSFIGNSYLAIKDPEGAMALKTYYGEENVVVILVHIDDGISLMRAVNREITQPNPKYADLCRRYLREEEEFKNFAPDFIIKNDDIFDAVKQLKNIIKTNRKGQTA